jgi:uncharacterized protein (DUF433 family)
LADLVSVSDPFRTGKAYSVTEAARLAKTTPQTVRRWLLGYHVPGHHMEPVFGRRERDAENTLQVSFLELIEIAIAAHWRRMNVQLRRIRDAHEFARRRLYVPFPFATMDFKIQGGHIIHEFEVEEPVRFSGMMAFDANGQWALPIQVQEELEAIDFEKTGGMFATRWFPFGRKAHVLIDPHLSAGRPVIEGTRIPITAIQERFDAGESIRFLAKDYGVSISVVEEVLRLRPSKAA